MLFTSAPSLSPTWHGQAGGLELSQCQGATAGPSALICPRQNRLWVTLEPVQGGEETRMGQASACVLEPTAKPSAVTGEV